MPVVTLAEVQAWLEQTKMNLTTLDTEVEAAARAIVFGKVSAVYPTTTWVDEATTPKLIRTIVAMYTAALLYNRQYSEEDPDGSGYAKWLMDLANKSLEGIASGNVDLPEVPSEAEPTSSPSFYPGDTVGLQWPEEAARFTIGKVF